MYFLKSYTTRAHVTGTTTILVFRCMLAFKLPHLLPDPSATIKGSSPRCSGTDGRVGRTHLDRLHLCVTCLANPSTIVNLSRCVAQAPWLKPLCVCDAPAIRYFRHRTPPVKELCLIVWAGLLCSSICGASCSFRRSPFHHDGCRQPYWSSVPNSGTHSDTCNAFSICSAALAIRSSGALRI